MKVRSSLLFFLFITAFACNDNKETAASIAKRWCEMDHNYSKAKEGPDKDAARVLKDNYEKKIMEEYPDKEFQKEIEKEIDKCESR